MILAHNNLGVKECKIDLYNEYKKKKKFNFKDLLLHFSFLVCLNINLVSNKNFLLSFLKGIDMQKTMQKTMQKIMQNMRLEINFGILSGFLMDHLCVLFKEIANVNVHVHVPVIHSMFWFPHRR